MSIKGNSKEPDSADDEWQGPWGSIMATPHSVASLCLVCNGDRQTMVSYPYRTLNRWKWQDGEPESLEIQAANHRIKVVGRGLRRLFEAIELEQLKTIRDNGGKQPDATGSTCVYSILIEEVV